MWERFFLIADTSDGGPQCALGVRIHESAAIPKSSRRIAIAGIGGRLNISHPKALRQFLASYFGADAAVVCCWRFFPFRICLTAVTLQPLSGCFAKELKVCRRVLALSGVSHRQVRPCE